MEALNWQVECFEGDDMENTDVTSSLEMFWSLFDVVLV